MISAYEEKRKRHTLQTLIEGRCMVTHNDPLQHWLGNHGTYTLTRDALSGLLRDIEACHGEYIDGHAWKFTPDTFGEIISGLNSLGYIHLSIRQLCQTLWGRFEFLTILQKKE